MYAKPKLHVRVYVLVQPYVMRAWVVAAGYLCTGAVGMGALCFSTSALFTNIQKGNRIVRGECQIF